MFHLLTFFYITSHTQSSGYVIFYCNVGFF